MNWHPGLDWLAVGLSGLALLGACVAPSPAEPDPVDDGDGPGGCDLEATPSLDLVLTDVAADLGVQDPTSMNNGAAAEDFDGDGDLDLFLANPSPSHRLLLQQDDGSFAPHPSPPALPQAPAASAIDYDNDGDVDLYVACGTWEGPCASRLFRNEGNDGDGLPVFVDVTDAVGLLDPTVSNFGGAWADYDLDGDLDLFQGCKRLAAAPDVPSADQLWRNDDGVFVEVAAAAGLDGGGDSHQAAWIDADGDGLADLVVPVRNGPNRLYRNLGDGTFVEDTPEAMEEPQQAFAAVVADFDQDGVDDILISGRTIREGDGTFEQDHGLFLGDGVGGFEDWTFGTGLNDPGDGATHIETMGLQVGDLDLDGYPEVLFGTGDPDGGERNALGSFRPDADSRLRWVDRSDLVDDPGQASGGGAPPYPFRTHGMVIADMDGDGDVDLFMGNGGGQVAEPNQLWRNDSPERHHALTIRLEGTAANRRGVGARVRISDAARGESTWAVWRTVQAGSGFNSSRPARNTIGLGHCEGPYHVTVDWPGGATQVLSGVEEQTEPLVIQEP